MRRGNQTVVLGPRVCLRPLARRGWVLRPVYGVRRPGILGCMRISLLDARQDVDSLDVTCSASIVPAIDEFVSRFTSREFVSGGEVVDVLLDLRLIAVADEIVATRG